MINVFIIQIYQMVLSTCRDNMEYVYLDYDFELNRTFLKNIELFLKVIGLLNI